MVRFARSLGYDASRSYEIKIHRLITVDSKTGLLSLFENQLAQRNLLERKIDPTSRPEFSVNEKYFEEQRIDSQPPEFQMKFSRSVVLQSRVPRPVGKETNPNSWISRRRSAKSPGSLEKVRHWLKTCCQEHVPCQFSLQGLHVTELSHFSSSIRLIQVEDSGDVPKIRLITATSAIPEYVTLSHRWPKDSSRMFQTNTANLDAHFTSIPFLDLPESFRNAIDFARAIDICHLWIDSICIIQDDQEDWKIQSKLMGSIFQHSFCTFAAVDARSLEDADDGLFSNCDSPVSILLQNDYHSRYDEVHSVPDDTSKMIYRLRGQGVDIVKDSRTAWRTSKITLRPALSSFHTLIELSDWNRRGWIFQERILSKRIIHFTKEQLFWECAERVASEHSEMPTGPASLRANERSPRLQAALREFVGNNDNHDPTLETSGPDDLYSKAWVEHKKFDVWWRLIEEYSACQLTIENDKWYAIAGISTLLKDVFHDEINHGIWCGAVGAGILWNAQNDALQEHHTTNSPSWSWLAVKGAVQYQYQDDSYIGYAQKAKPLYQSSFTHLGTESRSAVGSGLVTSGSVLALCCPTMVAKVSSRRFGDFVFRETSGRYQQDPPAWEFFDDVTHGVSQIELTKEDLRIYLREQICFWERVGELSAGL